MTPGLPNVVKGLEMSAPTGVLAIPDGSLLLVMWDEDSSIAYFNVYVSIDNSEYDLVKNDVVGTNVVLGGLPLNKVIKVRVDGELIDGTLTATTDAKLGKRFSDTVTLRVTGISGSSIGKDTVLVLRNKSGSKKAKSLMVGFPSDVNI